MEQKHRELIQKFFSITKQLEVNGLTRSTKYLGDIGEFICANIYSLKLLKNQREKGYDAVDNEEKKYQIKINNSSQKTNQSVGDKSKYDYLFLLITSNSLLFNKDKLSGKTLIAVYKIESKNIVKSNIAKDFINKLTPCLLLDSEFNTINN